MQVYTNLRLLGIVDGQFYVGLRMFSLSQFIKEIYSDLLVIKSSDFRIMASIYTEWQRVLGCQIADIATGLSIATLLILISGLF